MRLTYGWLALATATLAVPVFFVGDSLAQILTVEAAILGFAGARLRNVWLGGGSALLFLHGGMDRVIRKRSATPEALRRSFPSASQRTRSSSSHSRSRYAKSARADRANRTELQATHDRVVRRECVRVVRRIGGDDRRDRWLAGPDARAARSVLAFDPLDRVRGRGVLRRSRAARRLVAARGPRGRSA